MKVLWKGETLLLAAAVQMQQTKKNKRMPFQGGLVSRENDEDNSKTASHKQTIFSFSA